MTQGSLLLECRHTVPVIIINLNTTSHVQPSTTKTRALSDHMDHITETEKHDIDEHSDEKSNLLGGLK